MDEKTLVLIEERLSALIRKFKKNAHERDGYRAMATADAKKAMRRVIMIAAIHGKLKKIKPIFDKKKGIGWEIVDGNNITRKIFGDSLS